jgi:hypothetical protein
VLVIRNVQTIFLVEVSHMGLFKRKQVIETKQTEELVPEEVPEVAFIRYEAGKGGKGSKGSFEVGSVNIPASVITRLERLCVDKSEQSQAFIIHGVLGKKYPVLESIEARNISYPDVLRQMIAMKPVKKATQGHRGNRTEKTAQMLSRVIVRRWRGTEAEITAAFFEAIQQEALKTELSKVIQGFEAAYGRNGQGFIKANARKGRDLKGKAIKRK